MKAARTIPKAPGVKNNSYTEDKLLLLGTIRWAFVRGFKSHYFTGKALAEPYAEAEGRSYSAVGV